MDNLTLLLLVAAAIVLPICGLGVGLVVIITALGRRNAAQAGALKTEWAAIARAHGLAFDPGTALKDPSLNGAIDGQTVTLTLTRYRMGSNGMSHVYTVASAPVPAAGELLIAERQRAHHVDGVAGADVAIADPGFASTHIVRGAPELATALLTPELIARLSQSAVSHVRLARGRVRVQRPGELSDEAACLALLHLAADLARRTQT